MPGKAIIIDIDGTIADLAHRRHHVSGTSKNWTKFFDEMGDDLPFQTVIDTITAILQVRMDVTAFICTGRPDDYRQATADWLAQYAPVLWNEVLRGEGAMLMRPADERKSDIAVKRDMLQNIEAQDFEVIATFDDRQGVVDMWRSNGITCFQTAPGDWDNKPPVSPGTLHMMVGPSGSGKSTFAADQFPASAIVSSDALRAEINNGVIRDQSKNGQVFSALRAMVKARVENGLDVVADATNLRNRDRRTLRDAVPRTCHIIYHIIDRPMDEKVRDAGWRADVVIKEQSLIEYHDNIFRSNLKDILAGDGDPRVDVEDHRDATAT